MHSITPSAVATLAVTQLGPATRVLWRAFHAYPLLRYAFAEQAARYDELLTTMFRQTLSRRMAYEGQVLGGYHGQELAGGQSLLAAKHG